MVLKLHMQHDQAAGFQNDEIQHGQESKIKWPLLLKIAKPIKSTLIQHHMVYLAEILHGALVGP